MIGMLQGSLGPYVGETEVIVDVGGVGYRVHLTTRALAHLESQSDRGEGTVTFFIHTHVREDAICLFGFLHDDERRCFEVLLSAHGVGPTLAMTILSVFSPATLSTAVIEDDVDFLCTIPGIGKKTAARLILDLKSRLSVPDFSSKREDGEGGELGGSKTGDPLVSNRAARTEARVALGELGYGSDEIHAALEGADPNASVEELLRAALRSLAVR